MKIRTAVCVFLRIYPSATINRFCRAMDLRVAQFRSNESGLHAIDNAKREIVEDRYNITEANIVPI